MTCFLIDTMVLSVLFLPTPQTRQGPASMTFPSSLHLTIMWHSQPDAFPDFLPPNAGLKRFQLLVYVLSPLQVLLYGGILAWACTIAPLTESLATETVSTGGAYGWIVAINASVATWSTLILNVADLSRFCPTQKDQIIGQVRRQLCHPPMATWVNRNARSRVLLLAVFLVHLSVMG